MQEIPMCY